MLLAVVITGLVGLPTPASAQTPLTVAEKSGFKATARHAEVVAFCQQLAKTSPVVRLGELGTSFEGRKLPLLVLADPPVATPEEAAKGGRLVVFALGNIHAGEVDGKEGLLMLARDLAAGKSRPLLKDLVVVLAPVFNADGGDRIARSHRPHQVGPEEGVGIRANAQGFDLNRDFVKLESPEVRALVRLLNRWDPALVVDTHTTNGSRHRYTLTYDGPRNPADDPAVRALAHDGLLPGAARRLEKATGFASYYYGNFELGHAEWTTYPPQPRYGVQYVGLRNRLGILSESYAYASYKDRVVASREFVRACFEYAAANKDRIKKVLAAADAASARAGKQPGEEDRVALRQKAAPVPGRVTIRGFEGRGKDGAPPRPKDYAVTFLGHSEPTVSVRRAYAYLLPDAPPRVVELLQRHGIAVEELREDVELDLEAYRVDKVERSARPFQKHRLVTAQVTPRRRTRRVRAGTVLVRTGQRLGTLASYLLEPQAEDGLCTWGFFDAALRPGQDYPVLRLPAPTRVTSGPVRPLAEDRPRPRPITFDLLEKGRAPSLGGNPVALTWLDGEHYLQTWEGRRYKVHAETGRSEPYAGPAPVKAANFPPKRRRPPAGPPKGGREVPSKSPDSRSIAFVRGNNLYVEDVATKKERALTADGGENVLNGRADWVYWEELFNHDRQAYWWSPDGGRLAFLRFDEKAVPRATVIDYTGVKQGLEVTPYPRSGDPNPQVRLGIVPVKGGPVRWVDLSGYTGEPCLIVRVGWLPDGKGVYFYVQDRTQTWLDVCTAPPEGGKPRRLFRDTTRAWVEDLGPLHFLRDGSFLFFSERTGWKHLYHAGPDGQLRGAVTRGEWEARGLEGIDEESGLVYVTGTRDSATASNLYRVKLDGSGLERLTRGAGGHHVRLNPDRTLFLDWHGSPEQPAGVRLYRSDGTPVRTVDTNPAHEREGYVLGRYERMQIPTPDGFLLEASLLKPVNFDPAKKYPVWFMTYGGPHAPTISDGAPGPLRVGDEARANLGFLVFRCDPRSASGKGAVSAWACYRRLGVQELKDVDTAVDWLTAHPWADASRVGMSGGSYGGFLTSFALTHSKRFAAGVASAPVTDWHNYDSIYTERYMGLPRDNAVGYDVTSVVKAAKNLHGRLLLIHGLKDDNVHVQNTVQLVHALQRADKDFEVMVYPLARHGFGGRHHQRLVLDFLCRVLRPEPGYRYAGKAGP
jgi:dipeptidyl aminopeptidase/acylaminoacyl peptidase